MNRTGKIVICPDKFKGGLSSDKVASAIREGLERFFPGTVEIQTVEMADGGDGSADLFGRLTEAKRMDAQVCGPLGNTISSYYMMSGETAFVECAKACGLAIVPDEKRNPLNTTTFGVGQLIREALEKGARTIYVGVGGSSSNDCGIGMLQGLGFSVGLPDGEKGRGGNLHLAGQVLEPSDKVLLEKIKSARFIIINDVDNPLCGPEGAARVYSLQKGADEQMAKRLDGDAAGFLSRCGRTSFSRTNALEASLFPGAGTAGGMGFALLHFLGAESISGFEFFGEKLQDLSAKIAEADLVISGEGRIDSQSLYGKVVGGCCKALRSCKDVEDKHLWLFCGKGTLDAEEIASACGGAGVKLFQLADIESDMKARMKREYPLLVQLSYRAAKELDTTL